MKVPLTRIKKKLLEREEGGAVLDAMVILIILLVFILILVHFGYTFSGITTSLRKFFGFIGGY